jgi:hypothetical protein
VLARAAHAHEAAPLRRGFLRVARFVTGGGTVFFSHAPATVEACAQQGRRRSRKVL